MKSGASTREQHTTVHHPVQPHAKCDLQPAIDQRTPVSRPLPT